MATAQLTPPSLTIGAQELKPGVYSPPEPQISGLLPPQEENFVPPPALPTEVLVPPDQLPNLRPSHVSFAAIRDPRLRMTQAILLDVTFEESNVVVYSPEIEEFGTGDTLTAALEDFGASARELYYRLAAPDVILGTDLQRIKGVLDAYLQRR